MTKSSLDGNTPTEARRKIAAFFGDPVNRTASALKRLPPETFLRTQGVDKIRSGAARNLHVYRIGTGEKCSLAPLKMSRTSPEIAEGAFTVADSSRIQSKDGCYFVKMGTALLRYIRENSQGTGAERAADALDAMPVPRAPDAGAPRRGWRSRRMRSARAGRRRRSARAPDAAEAQPPRVAPGNTVDQRATEALGVALQVLDSVDGDPRVVPVVRVINTVLRTGLDHVRSENLL